MPTMADAVEPANIPPGVAAVAGYLDGSVSQWPAEAWAEFTVPTLKITVLGNASAMCFDVEPGNVTAQRVAVAVQQRTNAGLPSVVYVDANTLALVVGSLKSKQLALLPVSSWPAPGPYLWAADWSVEVGHVPTWCPVFPVAVQDRHPGGYDLSTLYGGWLPVVTANVPVPPSTPGKADDMVILRGPDGSAYVVSGGKAVGLTTGAEITAAQAASIPVWQFANQAQYDAVVKGFA